MRLLASEEGTFDADMAEKIDFAGKGAFYACKLICNEKGKSTDKQNHNKGPKIFRNSLPRNVRILLVRSKYSGQCNEQVTSSTIRVQ